MLISINAALQLLSHKQSSGTCSELGGFTKQVQAEVRLHQLSTANALQLHCCIAKPCYATSVHDLLSRKEQIVK